MQHWLVFCFFLLRYPFKSFAVFSSSWLLSEIKFFQESVSSRLHNTTGWRKLLASAGFILRPAQGQLPDAIFFPSPAKKADIEVGKSFAVFYSLLVTL